jgi:copper chaperone NosL
MSYQPPLLGTKQLLNFTTTAYPGVGGLLAMLGVGLGALALVYEFVWARMFRCECSTRVVEKAGARVAATVASMVLMVFMVGCARGPQTISYGTDACEFCSMTISDDRYGAAIVTSKGRTHKFDSVECMLRSVMEGEELAGTRVGSWYATSYPTRAKLVDATAVVFLVSPNLPSPMGAGVTAFSARQDAERMQQEKGGEVMDWAGVENFIRSWSKS